MAYRSIYENIIIIIGFISCSSWYSFCLLFQNCAVFLKTTAAFFAFAYATICSLFLFFVSSCSSRVMLILVLVFFYYFKTLIFLKATTFLLQLLFLIICKKKRFVGFRTQIFLAFCFVFLIFLYFWTKYLNVIDKLILLNPFLRKTNFNFCATRTKTVYNKKVWYDFQNGLLAF